MIGPVHAASVTELDVQLLTEKQAADWGNWSTALLRKWRQQRKGPPYLKVGKLIRYRMSDLEAFVAMHERTPVS
jgi:Helix-turn-helix domain